MTVKLEVEDVKGDVLNVVRRTAPGDIARKAGLHHHQQPLVRRRLAHDGIEGGQGRSRARRRDAVRHPACRNPAAWPTTTRKIAAAAIVELLNGRSPQPVKIINTCYSFVSQKEAIRVSSVHEWDATQGTLIAVKGSGGVSAARSEAEGTFAWNWAKTIWADSLA